VKEGGVVVQRVTIHAWNNRTEGIVRDLFVLVPAEKVVVGDESGERRLLDATRFEVN